MYALNMMRQVRRRRTRRAAAAATARRSANRLHKWSMFLFFLNRCCLCADVCVVIVPRCSQPQFDAFVQFDFEIHKRAQLRIFVYALNPSDGSEARQLLETCVSLLSFV